jgi:hypothetical protein
VSHQVFGIRHHGPGCARSLLSALESLLPDAILIEGPSDAADVLPLASSAAMKPPVALLVYPPENPSRSVFYPFAEFSPEWQAIRFGQSRGIPVRFMDLPQTFRLSEEETPASDEESAPVDPGRLDPIGALAKAAGYTDSELWWEHQIERRKNATGLFEAILEAMRALRESAPLHEQPADKPEEARREAFMRQTLRAAMKEGFQRIAVVCGAWHAPVLDKLGPAKPDAELLKGLTKTKTVATWIPWTPARLSYRSGYGAGVTAPGWYQHLWTQPTDATLRWAVRVARVLRQEDLPASTANVIETVRLADTLAALRGLGSPGLSEINESVQAVLCAGQWAPLALVRDQLEIGTAFGEVPPETPTVPIKRDLEVTEKRLRLKRTGELKSLDLDLRETSDRERSVLLHRLRLLDVNWGTPKAVSGKAGTFHEAWDMRWHPELEVALIEACRWGNTIIAAATGRATHLAAEMNEVGELTGLLDRAVLAELDAGVGNVLTRLQATAALSSDVRQLAEALPRLAQVARYGTVRGAAGAPVQTIFDGMLERIFVGLPNACISLDDDAAAAMVAAMGKVHEAIVLVEKPGQREEWQQTLSGLVEREAIAPMVRGRAARLLHDQGRISKDALLVLASRALSRAIPPATAAAWIQGLLAGSGLLLVHQCDLLAVLDAWLAALAPSDFEAMLPLLRRTFAEFQPPERRAMGEIVRGLHGAGPQKKAPELDELDAARADLVMPVLAHVLGVPS